MLPDGARRVEHVEAVKVEVASYAIIGPAVVDIGDIKALSVVGDEKFGLLHHLIVFHQGAGFFFNLTHQPLMDHQLMVFHYSCSDEDDGPGKKPEGFDIHEGPIARGRHGKQFEPGGVGSFESGAQPLVEVFEGGLLEMIHERACEGLIAGVGAEIADFAVALFDEFLTGDGSYTGQQFEVV